MIRYLKKQGAEEGKLYVEISCTSDDTKPEEDFLNGSILNEVDTGKVYFFNEEASAGSKWVEQFSFQD